MAANPTDPKRPTDIAGIAFDKIDASKAIPACRAAVKGNPDEPRCAGVSKDLSIARDWYRRTADAGDAAAAARLKWLEKDIGDISTKSAAV